MDDDVGHVWLAVADVVFEHAGEVMSLRQAGRLVRRDGDEDYEAAVGAQEAKVARWLTRPAGNEVSDAPSLGLVGRSRVPGHDRLLERLKVRVDVLDIWLLAQARLDALGDLMRLGKPHVGLELQVQRNAMSAVVVIDGDVVHVAHERLGQGDGECAITEVEPSAARLEVYYDVGMRVHAAPRLRCCRPSRPRGRTLSLGTDSQELIGLWAAKTAIVIVAADRDLQPAIPQEHPCAVRSGQIPEHTWIFVLRWHGEPLLANAAFLPDDRSEWRDGYAALLAFREFAMFVVGTDSTVPIDVRPITTLPSLLQVWPRTAQFIHWPPVVAGDRTILPVLARIGRPVPAKPSATHGSRPSGRG